MKSPERAGGSGGWMRLVIDLAMAAWVVGVVASYYKIQRHFDLLAELLGIGR